ncbi:hypothetical protein FACS1894103_1970 [Campylobacterota bacterium]|nr:hypothetical protein FACS1894103_1970 [Campylobacterota bacterium]
MNIIEQLRLRPPESLAPLLLERFAHNERFFAGSDLQRLIDTPNKRLSLHIGANGVNIQDLASHTLLYDNFYDHTEQLARDPLANGLYEPISVQTMNDEPLEHNSRLTAQGINEILAAARSDPDFTPNKLRFDDAYPLPCVMFYGTGAFVELLQERLSAGAVIYEPDAEAFVISCYFVDYERFVGGGNLLIVSGRLEAAHAKRFFMERLFERAFVRLELTASTHPLIIEAKQTIDAAHKAALRGWGTAEDELIGIQNALANMRNGSQRLLDKRRITHGAGCAIAVAGNGASLPNSFDFLRSNREKLVIISAGTALKPLKTAGITPDFHIETERQGHLAAILQAAPIGEIPLIAATIVDPSTLAAAESYCFVRDANCAASLFEPYNAVPFSAPVVGNAAVSIALLFGREIYLCGMDAGFKKDARQHAAGSFYDESKDTSAEQFPVRGNLSGDIYSNALLTHSKDILELTIAANNGCKAFNLSDGAMIIGATPLANPAPLTHGDRHEAVRMIKSCFLAAGNGRAFDLSGELNGVSNELIRLFRADTPRTTSELFALASRVFAACERLASERPVAGMLLRGTLWHLLNALVKSLLFINRHDISALYLRCTEIVEKTLRAIATLEKPSA